MTFFIDMVNF